MVCELRAYVESAYNLSAKLVISSEMMFFFSEKSLFYCTSFPLMPSAAIKL